MAGFPELHPEQAVIVNRLSVLMRMRNVENIYAAIRTLQHFRDRRRQFPRDVAHASDDLPVEVINGQIAVLISLKAKHYLDDFPAAIQAAKQRGDFAAAERIEDKVMVDAFRHYREPEMAKTYMADRMAFFRMRDALMQVGLVYPLDTSAWTRR